MMKVPAVQAFEGLSPEMPVLLHQLKNNNSKEWFRAHREDYRTHVSIPMAALAEELMSTIRSIDPLMSKKLSRPHRDIRFSRDNSPYRTESWLAFVRSAPEWTDSPAFFFEANLTACRWGMGYFSARPATMVALRNVAQDNPRRFSAAIAKAGRASFVVEGELYKRPPPMPPSSPDSLAPLYRQRNIYMCHTSNYQPSLFKPGLADTLVKEFRALASLYQLFCSTQNEKK